MSLKIKEPTLNLWVIFEAPLRNFDWLVTLPSIIQLQSERKCMFTFNHQAICPSYSEISNILPMVVNDCMFRIWVRLLGGSYEALLEVNPLISRLCSAVRLLGLKVHWLAQSVHFGTCDFVTWGCGQDTDVSHWTIKMAAAFVCHLNNWATNLSVKMFVDASELLEYAAMNCVLQVHAALYVCL